MHAWLFSKIIIIIIIIESLKNPHENATAGHCYFNLKLQGTNVCIFF